MSEPLQDENVGMIDTLNSICSTTESMHVTDQDAKRLKRIIKQALRIDKKLHIFNFYQLNVLKDNIRKYLGNYWSCPAKKDKAREFDLALSSTTLIFLAA